MGQGISVNTSVNVNVIKRVRTKSETSTIRSLRFFEDYVQKDDKILDEYITNKVKKLAVIFCNSYDKTCYELGDCAKNDGILAYTELTNYGYNSVLYHDLSRSRTLELIDKVTKLLDIDLVIYYIGHGTRVRTPYSKFEKSGLDSAFYTITGTIVDNELHEILIKNRQKLSNKNKLRFISDCCHSGSIYDLTIDDYNKFNMLSIGACQDTETAKQDYIERRGNGIFSYYFWKYYKIYAKNYINNPAELISKINSKLRVYNQSVETNIDNILDNKVELL